jgi:hypothetical protein
MPLSPGYDSKIWETIRGKHSLPAPDELEKLLRTKLSLKKRIPKEEIIFLVNRLIWSEDKMLHYNNYSAWTDPRFIIFVKRRWR